VLYLAGFLLAKTTTPFQTPEIEGLGMHSNRVTIDVLQIPLSVLTFQVFYGLYERATSSNPLYFWKKRLVNILYRTPLSLPPLPKNKRLRASQGFTAAFVKSVVESASEELARSKRRTRCDVAILWVSSASHGLARRNAVYDSEGVSSVQDKAIDLNIISCKLAIHNTLDICFDVSATLPSPLFQRT
jgi:hypothetical protein